MCIYCIYNSMNVCKWCMSGSATEHSILLSVPLRLNKNFNQLINQVYQNMMLESKQTNVYFKMDRRMNSQS